MDCKSLPSVGSNGKIAGFEMKILNNRHDSDTSGTKAENASKSGNFQHIEEMTQFADRKIKFKKFFAKYLARKCDNSGKFHNRQ